MKIPANISVILLASGLLVAGSCKKVVTPPSAIKHEEWIASLNDSIANYKKDIDSITNRMEDLRLTQAAELENFRFVKNSREVAGYYILKSWSARYPLSSTGLIARLNNRHDIEISAVLSSGKFTHINLSAGGDSYMTPSLRHDQALNYIANGINTVCFSGPAADSIGQFISRHVSQPITVKFIENSTSGSYTLPDAEKQMINSTWSVYDSQRELVRLEKELSYCSAKVNACRKVLLAKDTVKNSVKERGKKTPVD